MPRTMNVGAVATSVQVVDEGELTNEQVEELRIYEDVDSDESDESEETDESDESDFLGASMDAAVDPPGIYPPDLDPPIHVTARDGVIEVNESDEETDEPIWDDAIERKKDEATYAAELRKAQDELVRAVTECDDAKGYLKDAKAFEKLSIDYLKSLVVTGVRYRKKPEPKPVAQVDTETGEVIPAVEPNTSTEWRSWETASILDGIEGLGAKKRDSLLESFPTFGHLMDARTEAGKEHVPFHSMLPKGIGESIGTELIERMDKK
ncbi:MAG: hypothetical protein ACOVLE_16835, partial [Pirellula staleyi]